jgi:chromosome segregation protein
MLFFLRWRELEASSRTASESLAAAAEVVAERTQRAAEASTVQADAAAALPPLRETEAVKSAALQRLLHERNSLDAEEARAREDAQRTRQRIGQADQDLSHERALEQDANSALPIWKRKTANSATRTPARAKPSPKPNSAHRKWRRSFSNANAAWSS